MLIKSIKKDKQELPFKRMYFLPYLLLQLDYIVQSFIARLNRDLVLLVVLKLSRKNVFFQHFFS